MTKLLFVTRRPPWPLTNGGRIRSHRLLEGLAAEFDTTLICPAHEFGGPDGEVDLAELGRALPEVRIRTVPGLAGEKRTQQLRSLFRRSSWQWGRYAMEPLSRAIADTVRTEGIDIVHANDLGTALAMPVDVDALRVYSSHNVEYRIIDGDRTASSSRVRQLFAALESQKVRREERQVWSSVDLTLAVSEFDAAIIEAEGNGSVRLCPNGTDPAPCAAPRTRRPEEPLRLLFVGSAAYSPYERGLAWFVSNVLPLVRRRHDVVFDVVGQKPQRPVEAKGVRYHGFVDSIGPWYEAADIVVVPVFEGSGTRLKLVEAAVRRRPVVTTELGAQGLPLMEGRDFLQAESPEEFAAAIERVIADPEGTGAMVDAAARAVEHLLWPNISADLARLYRELLATRARADVHRADAPPVR